MQYNDVMQILQNSIMNISRNNIREKEKGMDLSY